MKLFGGVDPGKLGYLVIIDENKKIVVKERLFEETENDFSLYPLQGVFRNCIPTGTFLLVEDVHAIFGSSAKATFNFGFVVGALEMAFVLSDLPFSKVKPKAWQKEIWEGIRESDDTKLMSLEAARRLFPGVDFHKVSSKTGKVSPKVIDDNFVDALLIAEYCRRKNF